MKVSILLKDFDADGLGGEILTGLGMRRITATCWFEAQHIQDPRLVAPPDCKEGMWAAMYAEALMDAGIRPMRICQRTDSTASLTPVFANAAPQQRTRQQVISMIREMADALSR